MTCLDEVIDVDDVKLDRQESTSTNWVLEVAHRYIDYCMHRVDLLRHHQIIPVLVFDGGLLPMKANQESKRQR